MAFPSFGPQIQLTHTQTPPTQQVHLPSWLCSITVIVIPNFPPFIQRFLPFFPKFSFHKHPHNKIISISSTIWRYALEILTIFVDYYFFMKAQLGAKHFLFYVLSSSHASRVGWCDRDDEHKPWGLSYVDEEKDFITFGGRVEEERVGASSERKWLWWHVILLMRCFDLSPSFFIWWMRMTPLTLT